MSCLSDFIDGVATMEVLQRWRRWDLAEKWRALEVLSARVYGGERCLERFLDLPPNLLYAKVGSQDCSPSQLRTKSVGKILIES
jgi:hypothetical protein